MDLERAWGGDPAAPQSSSILLRYFCGFPVMFPLKKVSWPKINLETSRPKTS